MPLPFVGTTTTIRMDDNQTHADFEIPAVDVTIGTSPKGSAWRRNPIPACTSSANESVHDYVLILVSLLLTNRSVCGNRQL